VFIVVCGIWTIGESGVVMSKRSLQADNSGENQNIEKGNNAGESDCSQFIDDYDILRHFPFPVVISLATNDLVVGASGAARNKNNTFIDALAIYEEKVVPSIVFCLSNLRTLKVERTPFENNIIPDSFANLKKLQYFWFYDSPIVKLTDQLITLENLSMLTLHNCSITHLPNLSNLQKLWSLDLSNNRLSRVDGIPNVMFLDLGANFFTEIPITEKRDALMYLKMNGNPLKNALPIMYYKNLEGIELRNTSLTFIPPDIDKLRKLKYVDVSENKLTNIPKNILSLPLLEEFNITNNRLSPRDIQSIRKEFENSHPNLEFIV